MASTVYVDDTRWVGSIEDPGGRTYRGTWSLVTCDNVGVLYTFCAALRTGVRLVRPVNLHVTLHPADTAGEKDRLAHVLVTERARYEAVQKGAIRVPFGSRAWAATFGADGVRAQARLKHHKWPAGKRIAPVTARAAVARERGAARVAGDHDRWVRHVLCHKARLPADLACRLALAAVTVPDGWEPGERPGSWGRSEDEALERAVAEASLRRVGYTERVDGSPAVAEAAIAEADASLRADIEHMLHLVWDVLGVRLWWTEGLIGSLAGRGDGPMLAAVDALARRAVSLYRVKPSVYDAPRSTRKGNPFGDRFDAALDGDLKALSVRCDKWLDRMVVESFKPKEGYP